MWIGEVMEISLEHNDINVLFYHPAGPRTSFKKSSSDKIWVPLQNVLRKLSVLELTTSTGRSHNISRKLCEEISELLNGRK